MIDKRTVTAAEAFRKSLLNCGAQLMKNKALKVDGTDGIKDLGIRRLTYKYVTLDAALLCSLLSKTTTELYVSQRQMALGPLPVSDKVRKHLADKTVLPWGNPTSLSIACPEVLEIAECEDRYKKFKHWKSTLKEVVSDGSRPFQNYVVLENGAKINVIYYTACAIHVSSKDSLDEAEVYQRPGAPLSPVVFASPKGVYAVSMPIR
tara:strand:+ start:703 stop:1320 length:618 start_codon:yes stop_codon:yes gene_type:complete